ncbi:MAG: hypothetical protein JG718_10410 [Candidatus Thiothrix moscowensis]|nr:hypothetical protein [Candidatus Thiothrix moscowensis]
MKNKILAVVTGLFLSLPVMAATYGPVKSSETLWDIASRTRPSYEVSTQQMMLSIRTKNPQAFSSNNINSLQDGVVLQLPTLAEIQQLDRGQALRTAKQHNQSWDSPGKTASNSSPSRKTASQTENKTTTLRNARATQARLQRDISQLKTQLQQEQQRSKRLSAQLKQLQTRGGNSQGSAAGNAAAADVSKLQAEVADLKAVLSDKNNHIKNLQASLKEASEAIKRQHSENLALYEQLKASNPQAVAEKPVAPPAGKNGLTLTGVGTEQAATPASGKPPAFTDQLPVTQQPQATSAQPPATTPAQTANAAGQGNGVALKDLLGQSPATATTEPAKGNLTPPAAQLADEHSPWGAIQAPSRVSFIIALISLLFILALLWRTFSQRRTDKRTDTTTSSPPGETGKPERVDGRQEPEIVF